MINPNLLKQLAIVVNQGSLTRACEQLHITQPTLTRSMKQLEMKVGASVLTRTRHGVIPTPIGARLARLGERILAEAEHGDEIIRQWRSGYHNEFRVGIDPLWEFATVDQMTGSLLTERQFVFHLRTGSAATQIHLLRGGKLDFLVAPAHLTVPQRKLERELVFRDRAGIFAGRKSALLGSDKAITRETLSNQQWIIAGAHAGFLDSQDNLTGNRAARMALTGSIQTLFHLLRTTDVLVCLPARLALMTGELDPAQMLDVADFQGTRRDIALWSHSEIEERPDTIKVRDLISTTIARLDQETETFELDI
ncbi:MAG: LysR family transcriptional regulator [Marinobacter sp.]|nr:LysR family transcriptional regulator [Marinobacter sp.]